MATARKKRSKKPKTKKVRTPTGSAAKKHEAMLQESEKGSEEKREQSACKQGREIHQEGFG